MSTLEARIANWGSVQLGAIVERFATDLGNSVGAREAAELLVAAAFILFYRAEGGEKTRWFARRCYWGAIQALD